MFAAHMITSNAVNATIEIRVSYCMWSIFRPSEKIQFFQISPCYLTNFAYLHPKSTRANVDFAEMPALGAWWVRLNACVRISALIVGLAGVNIITSCLIRSSQCRTSHYPVYFVLVADAVPSVRINDLRKTDLMIALEMISRSGNLVTWRAMLWF